MKVDVERISAQGTAIPAANSDHFLVLDGMRGVGAIIVVLAHSTFTIGLAPQAAFLVDFFFVLSGFVLSHAYERRLTDGTLSLGRFCELRVIRLYPMVAFAMLAGALPVLAKLFVWYRFRHLENAIFALGAGLLLIPLPPSLSSIPFSTSIYPYSLPSWSLYFESLSNVVYALCVRWITPFRLIVVTAVSGVCLTAAILRRGGVSFGPYWPEMGDGCWRILFSFSIGLLLHHFLHNRKPRRAGFSKWIFLAVLPVVSCLPLPYSSPATPYVEIAMVLILSPALVWFGSQLLVNGRFAQACNFLGRLSYPLYLTHWPIVVVMSDIIYKLHIRGPALAIALTSQILLAVGASALLLNYFDEPIRRYLTALRKRQRQKEPPRPVTDSTLAHT